MISLAGIDVSSEACGSTSGDGRRRATLQTALAQADWVGIPKAIFIAEIGAMHRYIALLRDRWWTDLLWGRCESTRGLWPISAISRSW